MDKNLAWVKEMQLKRTMENLSKHNMETFLVKNEAELHEKIKELTKEGSTVSVGGSMTLFETKVIDLLRSGKYNFLDRYKEGLTPDDVKDIYRQSFSADVYFTSSNAITENGELYNVDGNGNRVAAMIYGPDRVIVIAGVNKIVKDLDAAIERNKRVSAPSNTKRLDRKTPCATLGYCTDCNSPERICNDYVVIRGQLNKDRIKVIFIDQELGY